LESLSYGEPDGVVRISGVSGAASILLITERLDDDWVVERACVFP
jgi:hypothetical protein